MKVATISTDHIRTIRSIAKAEFAYDTAKTLASAAHWELEDDEFTLGYLRFNVELLVGESPRSLVVEFGKDDGPRFAFMGLFCIPDRNDHAEEFDALFHLANQALHQILGPPTRSGNYGYPHRDWLYSYSWWCLPDAVLVLVQDEFDIQDGFDVTIWFFPAGTPMRLPARP